MPAYVKDAGVWKEATVYVRDGGVWKLASPSVRDGGTWKAVAPAVTVTISPTVGWSATNPLNNHTFPSTSVTVTGGTASSYVWGFDFPSGGTWAVAGGQGTATAAARVTAVFDYAYADFYCDVTVNGQVYRVSASHSYTNTSGGGGGFPDF